jgi:hypothetical protein
MGEPCIEPDPMEVVGAEHQGFGWDTSLGCFGGVRGSCAGGTIELKPGAKHTNASSSIQASGWIMPGHIKSTRSAVFRFIHRGSLSRRG